MVASLLGDVTFPYSLGEGESGTVVRNVADTMLSDAVEVASIFRLAANRLFYFGTYNPGPTGEYGQVATHNYVYRSVSQTMLSDESGFNWNIDVIQYLGFTGPRVFVDAGDVFFNVVGGEPDSVNIGVVDSLSNSFSFSSTVIQAHNAVNTLSLTESINGSETIDVFQYLDLEAVIDSSLTEYERQPTQSVIQQHVSYTVQGASRPDREYSPFVGSSDDTTYPEVSTTPPTLSHATLTLTWPRITPTTTLVLKNPEFGNQDVITLVRVDRTTRGNERKIFTDQNWGITQSFILTIQNICEANVTVDELIDFLNDSLGQEVGLLDWEGRQWKGLIVEPETSIEANVGGYGLQLTFEGELV